jgi:DNA-binding NarL/FixJ family response regulator
MHKSVERTVVGLGQTAEAPTGRVIFLDRARGMSLEASAGASPLVRVLIADGQALVRAGFRALLEAGGRISVVAEAASGEQAVETAARVHPDVVLVDVGLPGLDCVEVTRRIIEESDAEVMLLTSSDSDERIFATLRAGASGLLLKDADPGELARAVAMLARGEALLSPGLTRRLMAEFVSRPEPQRPRSALLDELTPREREVVGLVAMGLSNLQIAERLVITPATAKTHVSRAMVKLHARDRAQLVVFAYETGLVLPRQLATA